MPQNRHRTKVGGPMFVACCAEGTLPEFEDEDVDEEELVEDKSGYGGGALT